MYDIANIANKEIEFLTLQKFVKVWESGWAGHINGFDTTRFDRLNVSDCVVLSGPPDMTRLPVVSSSSVNW